MDVLNHNERKSAHWRIFNLSVLTIGLLIVILFSIYGNLSSMGMDDIDQLKKKIKTEQQSWDAEKSGLDNDKVNLEKKLKNCQDNNKQDKSLVILKKNFKDREDRLQELEDELEECKDAIKAATNY